MHFRELSATTQRETIARYLGLLYSELFGRSARLSSSECEAVLDAWADGERSHWAFEDVDDAGEPRAFFTLAESFAFFAHGSYGILNELWVDPTLRSQGVGEAVIDFCARFGGERGWHRIDVTAPPDPKWDPTFEFYRKRGFVPTGPKLKLLVGPAS